MNILVIKNALKFYMRTIFYLLATIILITACDKNSDSPAPLSDIDGNQYDTVIINNQVWMKQNLKTAHYRNGDPIPEITSMSVWSTLTTGAWCWYNNDSLKYAATYGKLYNWYAVNDPRGLAPEGWHIPSDAEWTILSTSLGGDLVAGSELKETGTQHWETPNADATNSSGFTGLPGGYCNGVGTFDNIARYGILWSATEIDANYAWCRVLNFSLADFARDNEFKGIGLSVRCIQD